MNDIDADNSLSIYTLTQLEAAVSSRKRFMHTFELGNSRKSWLAKGIDRGVTWCCMCHLEESEHYSMPEQKKKFSRKFSRKLVF